MLTPIAESDYRIQTASWRDLNALRRLERECFPIDAWTLLDLMGVLSLPSVVRLKAVKDGEMLGFVAGDIRSREDMAWIATIAVRPAHQRRGIATALLNACEARLSVSKIRLSVRVSNKSAISLYERFGYRRVGLWSAYYQDRSDALVFEKTK